MDEEEPFFFHLLKTLRRRNTRAIQQIQDSHERITTRPQEVTNIFLNHLCQKFRPIGIDRDSLPTQQAHIQPLDTAAAQSLE